VQLGPSFDTSLPYAVVPIDRELVALAVSPGVSRMSHWCFGGSGARSLANFGVSCAGATAGGSSTGEHAVSSVEESRSDDATRQQPIALCLI